MFGDKSRTICKYRCKIQMSMGFFAICFGYMRIKFVFCCAKRKRPLRKCETDVWVFRGRMRFYFVLISTNADRRSSDLAKRVIFAGSFPSATATVILPSRILLSGERRWVWSLISEPVE